MLKRTLLYLSATFLTGMSLFAQSPLQLRETTLSNGLKVWMNEDHSQPRCYGAVVVRAGAVDCPDTGIAHYFEHIMFKGTDRIGTVDYAAEKVYLDSIETMYSRLAGTKDEEERKAIQQEINRLSLAAADYAIPNEFTTLISQYGGTGLNAGTSYDFTVYYNTFDARYLHPWAVLASERLISPVFRLFQGELETVYEEKNMGSDQLAGDLVDKAFAAFAGTDNPYAFPVIGSTENLKNPDQAAMKAFFEKYYVASNMGLILLGDFDADAALPLLEETFGRIPEGVEPEHVAGREKPLQGISEARIKLPIPIVSAEALCFNGPLETDPDAVDFQVALGVLNNSAGTGLLDSLMTEHKALALAAANLSFNHLGAAVALGVPNILGSRKKMEKMLWEQIDRVKAGDFSDRMLDEVRRDIRRDMEKALETVDGRGQVMMMVMSQGRNWEDYLASIDAVGAVTREQVMAAAKKYFDAENYLTLRKQYGRYPKDKVAAPEFKPVVPKHKGEASPFAQEMDANYGSVAGEPKVVDPATPEVRRAELGPRATLFAGGNPANELFDLQLSYGFGTEADPRLTTLAALLGEVGTDSLKVQELHRAWQRLGTSLSAEATANAFTLKLSGFEEALGESLALLRHFLDRIEVDRKTLKKTVSSAAQGEQLSFLSGPQEVFLSLMQWVLYGENAPKLRQLSSKEAAKLKPEEMTALLKDDVLASECRVCYSGKLPAEDVAALLRENLPLERCTEERPRVVHPYKTYDKPTVYFVPNSGARQVFVGTYLTDAGDSEGTPRLSPERKAQMRLWAQYFGGGMSSVLFEEIREYRAFAYSAFGAARMPDVALPDDPGAFIGYLSTQSDKFDSAMAVMDSLFREMPVSAVAGRTARQDLINGINNSYPDFRELPVLVASFDRLGLSEDPDKELYEAVKEMGIEEIVAYQREVVAPARRVWFVVGDKSKIDMKKLATYGEIVTLRKKDLQKK